MFTLWSLIWELKMLWFILFSITIKTVTYFIRKVHGDFLLRCSGLRVHQCCSCGIGWSCGLDLIPGPGTSICPVAAKIKKKKKYMGSSHRCAVARNTSNIHEDASLIPGLAQSRVAVSCDVGYRCSSDPLLLWLWYRPEDTVLIWTLAWELPYVAGVWP